MNNEYLELVKKAQNQRIQITNKQIKHLKNLYMDVAKDLESRFKITRTNNLNQRWLMDYRKQFKLAIKELNKILKKDIKKSMLEGAETANNIQLDFFYLLTNKLNLNFEETFSKMFSNIPKSVVDELILGEFYKDGQGLSKRLWNHQQKINKDIDYIIQKGLVEKKSIYDLSKDLEKYINPIKKQDWDFQKIYPGISNKRIEYNSFRLATTSISHAYQLSMQRSCKANPFVEGIKWHTSNSHRGPCSLCASREGRIYKSNELPLDHPLGVCYFTPIIEKSLEEIGGELHDWINGKNNVKLDRWFNKFENSDDIKEYEKYKSILSKEAPSTFDDFKNLKYNNSNRFTELENLFENVDWQITAQNKLKKGSVHKVPFNAEPNSVFDNYKEDILESRRYYGNTGKPRLDIDLTDHNNSKEHKIVPHAHSWNFKDVQYEHVDKDLQGREKTGRKLSKAEYIANKEVLGKVK